MKIVRRIFSTQSHGRFLIAAVCLLGASAVWSSGSFTYVPLGSA
jgi:hypothetical protein